MLLIVDQKSNINIYDFNYTSSNTASNSDNDFRDKFNGVIPGPSWDNPERKSPQNVTKINP